MKLLINGHTISCKKEHSTSKPTVCFYEAELGINLLLACVCCAILIVATACLT